MTRLLDPRDGFDRPRPWWQSETRRADHPGVHTVRLLDVLKSHPVLIRTRLVTGEYKNPLCCYVGALLLAANVSVNALATLPTDVVCWPQWVFNVLSYRYGLTREHVEYLVDLNDDTAMAGRRAVLEAAIRGLGTRRQLTGKPAQ